MRIVSSKVSSKCLAHTCLLSFSSAIRLLTNSSLQVPVQSLQWDLSFLQVGSQTVVLLHLAGSRGRQFTLNSHLHVYVYIEGYIDIVLASVKYKNSLIVALIHGRQEELLLHFGRLNKDHLQTFLEDSQLVHAFKQK